MKHYESMCIYIYIWCTYDVYNISIYIYEWCIYTCDIYIYDIWCIIYLHILYDIFPIVVCISWIGHLSYFNHSYILHATHLHIMHSKVFIHSHTHTLLWLFMIPPWTTNNKLWMYHMFNDDSMHCSFLSLYLFGIPKGSETTWPLLRKPCTWRY